MATEMTTTEETETTETVTSEDVRALAREDVSGDVTRSVAERGGYAVSSGCTSGAGTGSSKQTTETSEETETFCRGKRKTTETVTSEDVRALAREDVSGDVTRSVAERGGYAVSSGCTSGAGTGSSKQTTETSEETETFCRGKRKTTETVTSEDVRALAREDVSGDVTRSVAERGGYAVSSGCTSGAGTGSSKQTTETSEETETFCRGKRKTTETVTSEDVRALAREDVSGDVTRSVAERGGYAVSSGCTSGAGTGSSKQTTETSEETETFCRGKRKTTETVTSEDVRALAREDVSGDVTRSVAERGGYAVSSGCTSGAGTGSSKQTTETSEETETFCRGKRKTTETVTSEDVRALAREDVSGDVTRSVAERGGYAVSSGCTSGAGTGSSKQTTETSEETETFCRGKRKTTETVTSEDVRALAREDVSGDVTRSVAERGGYAVSSGCTSGAGTGSSKQTTETSEETETFCRGKRKTTETVTSEDVRALAREDVSGDVTRSVAERGGYAVSSGCTSGAGTGSSKQTTETSEETETFCRGKRKTTETVTSEDVRALAREDVSGDVTRSVAERGGYAVSSGCTSGAGTGSSKQTTETSEETETFCRGKRKTTETVTSEDVRALAREDVSGDVTRSVAERGGYAVSSGCTSGAGTGSSKQTTETSEETETFCRGKRKTTETVTSEDVRALAREDVSGDVTRSVAERGGYAVSSGCTSGAGTGSSKQTTETSEETETFCRGKRKTTETVTSEDVRALAREDVSGDVTRSVAERGGYAVSSGCTSGAGTGSSKQTTETSEETETFCRGKRKTTETVTSEDVRALAREDVSGDVTRSVAERGGYAVSSGCTSGAGTGSSKQTTETSEETETFCRGKRKTTETVTSEDVRALAREDVSGDVTRSVAERGGYAVSSGCTSGAGTGSSKQTTETSEETETFCRGKRKTTETVTSEDVRALAREDVSGDVTRSVAERGGYAVSSGCTSGAGTGSSKQTTETSEETETFCRGKRKTTETVTSEDVRALAREDVSGDVTRSVAERGGYAVSSGCTSGAGTGSSKQTTETSEETETFCRGKRKTTETVTSEDVRALAREDVSGDVTRSVAERGGYAVSSGCTSGAGTGSSKQTTETSEETETFCRGKRKTTETVTSEDVRALAREDVSGDVTRSVAERGGYAVSSGCTSGAGTGSSKQTTETSEETETFCRGKRKTTETVTSEDVRALAREDVSGDVTRSVAERGGYAVSSGCTSGAGTGSSKQTTETSEETETFCRGKRKTTETVTSEDVRALAREDVSGDVTRSVAERGGYAVSSGCTSGAGTGSSKQTTETSEETETFCRGKRKTTETVTSEDVRALAREDVSGDVTRSVAERGGYAVSSGCTSGAGTGSSKQTTETSEETETFCRGKRKTTETVTSEDVRALAREDVSGDVTRSVAERGGYAVSSGCTSGAGTGSSKQTTETSEETETFCRGKRKTTETVTSEDVRALAREDVSGDVTRSVAERGGYAVSSGCTSGAGTGSSKQTTETSEETETFCRGKRKTTETVTSEDVRALAREDVSGDVTRSVAERGGYAVSSGCTSGAGTGSSKQTTETSEETETFCRGKRKTTETVTSEDVRALAREDVSGDVTRRVAERGGYAVSSGCTSGAGTGSSKQTTETSEETETFCRGKRKTTETVTSEDVRALAREDVSGDVTRSVAERGGYAVSSGCTSGAGTGSSKQTTETSEETETFCRGKRKTTETVTSEDVRALAREDVSGDVTRSVAERGGYAVSSGCTSGAGTGSSKQTTETSEETETFCRGKRKTTETVTSEDVRALAREDVSGDVTRSVAERGGYAVSSGCTSGAGTGSSKQTTETSEETETFCRGKRKTTETVTSEDVRALAREDVSGDVTRSVAERGGYAVSSGCTSGAGTGSSKQTTETSEETETFCRGKRKTTETVTSEDVRALAREDVSGDVTRSVAERGGYAVSSGCTSGAGTGSSKQTTETSEETETFCRGKRKTTETVTSEDVRALAREDVSGDVTRSVAERGGYAVSSGCTSGAGTGSSKPTTETSEETETFCRGKRKTTETVTSEDVRALAREDVSGDVARRVAERGGYAVPSGCTSGAGTGSSKQTTETSEETETFCRGADPVKSPATTPAKSSARTPAIACETPAQSPAKTPAKSPATTPAKSPAKTLPKHLPTEKTSAKSPTNTPAKSPANSGDEDDFQVDEGDESDIEGTSETSAGEEEETPAMRKMQSISQRELHSTRWTRTAERTRENRLDDLLRRFM
ncbi:hypothetical protein PInf_027581 [Phytophthora infestans]|nr:hypothetical protein PInf_027581 [Phytophthora infestans]